MITLTVDTLSRYLILMNLLMVVFYRYLAYKKSPLPILKTENDDGLLKSFYFPKSITSLATTSVI